MVPCLNCGSPRISGLECTACHAVYMKPYRANYNAVHAQSITAYKAAWYQENRERLAVSGAAYYQENREYIRARGVAYYHNHKEAHFARSKAAYLAHPEIHARYVRAWAQRNPDKVLASSLAGVRRRRALKKGSLGHHTDAEWIAKKTEYGHSCIDCRVKEGSRSPNSHPMKLTRGHAVPLEPCAANDWHGGSDAISNIIPQCLRCNLRQGSRIHASVAAFSLFDRHMPEVALVKRRKVA
jgi:hypothetical protein